LSFLSRSVRFYSLTWFWSLSWFICSTLFLGIFVRGLRSTLVYWLLLTKLSDLWLRAPELFFIKFDSWSSAVTALFIS
jgi:hypothetical protein